LSYVILPAQTCSSKLCFHSVFSIVPFHKDFDITG
jgi:hypothetical protein